MEIALKDSIGRARGKCGVTAFSKTIPKVRMLKVPLLSISRRIHPKRPYPILINRGLPSDGDHYTIFNTATRLFLDEVPNTQLGIVHRVGRDVRFLKDIDEFPELDGSI